MCLFATKAYDATAQENQKSAFLRPLLNVMEQARLQGNKSIHLAPYVGDFGWNRQFDPHRKTVKVEIVNALNIEVMLPNAEPFMPPQKPNFVSSFQVNRDVGGSPDKKYFDDGISYSLTE